MQPTARNGALNQLLGTSYAGMNQIKFTGLESISAQPLRTPGGRKCTSKWRGLGGRLRGILAGRCYLALCNVRKVMPVTQQDVRGNQILGQEFEHGAGVGRLLAEVFSQFLRLASVSYTHLTLPTKRIV